MASVSPLDELVQLAANTTDAFTTALFLRYSRDQRYYLASHCSLSKHVDPRFAFSEGEGYWGWVVRHERPLNISPFNQVYGPLGIYRRREEVKSFLAVPLERKLGVLSVDSKATYVFTDRVAKLLQDFGHMVVKLRRLEEHLQRARQGDEFLSFLMEMGELITGSTREPELSTILEHCRAFMNAELAFWAERAHNDDEYLVRGLEGTLKAHAFLNRRFTTQDGLVGLAFRKGQGLFLERMGTESRKSFIFYPHERITPEGGLACIPIYNGKKIFAILGLTFLEPRAWTAHEKKALGLLSGLLAHQL
jgi:signal transduction protein with GAF and PtsI domain